MLNIKLRLSISFLVTNERTVGLPKMDNVFWLIPKNIGAFEKHTYFAVWYIMVLTLKHKIKGLTKFVIRILSKQSNILNITNLKFLE